MNTVFLIFAISNAVLPSLFKTLITRRFPLSDQQVLLTKCFSMLLLGMFLATLATINFSLSFLIGLLSAPLIFMGPSATPKSAAVSQKTPSDYAIRVVQAVTVNVFSPPTVVYVACQLADIPLEWLLTEAAFGWRVWGLWTQVIVWCVWWPAWLGCRVLLMF
jgi:glycosylphosphatidylinositol transamidase